MSRPKLPIAERFPLDLGDLRFNLDRFSSSYRIDPVSQCWLWTAGRHRQGYGMMGAYRVSDQRRIMVTAHRASWRIHRGPTGDLNIMHRCMNFHCVNPDHLALGTQSETLSKPGRTHVGWPPGRPRRSLRGRQLGRRAGWQYRFTDIEIQFLRVNPFHMIQQRWPDISVVHLRALRGRARHGYRWLPWPQGLEHLRPVVRSKKS